eukprot:g4351.t1
MSVNNTGERTPLLATTLVRTPSTLLSESLLRRVDSPNPSATRVGAPLLSRRRGGNPFMVGLTLCISVIGPGLLCIPFAFRSAGLVAGLLIVCGTACCATATAEMLLAVHLVTRCNSYDSMAQHLYGERSAARRLVPVVNLLALFGCCTGYMQLVLSLLPRLGWFTLPAVGVQGGPGPPGGAVAVGGALYGVVVLPLCLLRDLSSLRYSSAAGFACSVLLVFAIVRECYIMGDSIWFRHFYREGVFWGNGLSNAAALVNFAFVMHLNVIPAFHTLSAGVGGGADAGRRGRDRKYSFSARATPDSVVGELRHEFGRMRRITRTVAMCCAIVYCTTGAVAYCMFGNNTEDNILINLPDNALMRCARSALVFVALSAFPLMFAPLRATFHQLAVDYSVGPRGDEAPHACASRGVRVLEVVALMALCFITAVQVPGIGVVFSLTGGTAVVGIVYVFPAMFFLRVRAFDEGALQLRHGAWSMFARSVIIASSLVGLWHTSVNYLRDRVLPTLASVTFGLILVFFANRSSRARLLSGGDMRMQHIKAVAGRTPRPRVYFAGSSRGERQDTGAYQALIRHIDAKHADVLTEHVGSGVMQLNDGGVFERDMGWIESAGMVVAEVSTPSLGVGYKLATAEAHGIPTLCLYRPPSAGARLSAMLTGNRRKHAPLVREYVDESQARAIIDEFVIDHLAGARPRGTLAAAPEPVPQLEAGHARKVVHSGP